MNSAVENVYAREVNLVLPRVLSLFDTDSNSGTYGIGDRYHWAWGLIDFANGTYQGAANTFARLIVNDFVSLSLSQSSMLARVDSIFYATSRIMRKNGSLEEAFPYEASFCVTALVAYDLLTAAELLCERLELKRFQNYLAIVEPMIKYLTVTDETHGFISNHLATAAAAIYKWCRLTGTSDNTKGKELLEKILAHQSDEGWYKEYEGADPGYQTLCTYYLADIHRMYPELGLIGSLEKSIKFLWYFAHPDGSFGGLYGSRNTRFYYPAGIEYLASEIPEAAGLAAFMRESILYRRVVGLAAMDDTNLIPMLNAYCWAAALNCDYEGTLEVPSVSNVAFTKYWPEAGIFIEHDDSYYKIISTHKGGVIYHFDNKKLSLLDSGVIFKESDGRMLTTQAYQPGNVVNITDDVVEIKAELQPLSRRRMKPVYMFFLRAMNLTLMRIPLVRDVVKRVLVKMLITGRIKTKIYNTRYIKLGGSVDVRDSIGSGYGKKNVFLSIHMASQGYWQIQDDIEI